LPSSSELPGRHTKHLQEVPINITICKNLIQTPTEDERLPLISESHSSAVGGHKEVTKTYIIVSALIFTGIL